MHLRHDPDRPFRAEHGEQTRRGFAVGTGAVIPVGDPGEGMRNRVKQGARVHACNVPSGGERSKRAWWYAYAMLLIASSWLTGCTGGGGADYTLHLTPVVASPQSPLEGLDRIDLVLTPAEGDPVRVPMDAPTSGGTPEVTGLPELLDTRIAVEGYRDGDLVLRGLTEPLTASTGDVEATVFVAATETTAWLGALTEGVHLPLLAPLGGGRFWLAGGAGNSRTGEPSKGQDVAYVLTLAPPDEGLSFQSIGTLPPYEDADGASATARMGATCTVLTAAGDDQGKVLVTGGASSDPLRFGGEATKAASLYDPATDTWEDLPTAQALATPRVRHLALENLLGGVVIWGGFGASDNEGTELPNLIEFYDRVSGRFSESFDGSGLGQIDAIAADLGADGTLLCGGANIDGTGWDSADTCLRVRLDGSGVDEFERLPSGLAGAAAVTLADGRVLVTGGATTTGGGTNTSTDVDAVASAWLYNPTTEQWGSLAASMRIARVGHRMVLLADGRVLIVGGAESYNLVDPAANAVSCLEIYDPTSGTFTSVDDCDASDDAGGLVGRSQQAQVTYDPDYGVLIVGGLSADGSAQNGVSLFVPAL